MVAAAHFLSQVGLLFEVGWGVRGFWDAQILPDFRGADLVEQEQKGEPDHW